MFKYFKVCCTCKYVHTCYVYIPVGAYVYLSRKLMSICVTCIHVRMTFHFFLLLLDVLCVVTFFSVEKTGNQC